MAIIRSKRLFIRTIGPAAAGTLQASTPGVPDHLDPKAWTDVYTCPPGKRAILRSMQATLDSTPPGTEPVYVVVVWPYGTTVHWYWFVDHGSQIAVWRIHETWSPMLVLHSGDILSVANASIVNLHVSGSGHELPEVSQTARGSTPQEGTKSAR